jgi:hypothetical protein
MNDAEDAMSDVMPAGNRGVISGQALVDFSHLTSPQELAAITRIEGVGAVIVPQSLAAAYATIPSEGVGGTVYVPDDANVRVHAGPLMVGGDGLGAAQDVLVVVGMLIVTSPVTGALPRRITVVGSVLAPRGSEQALGPVLDGVGSVVYYRQAEGQDVKVLTGEVQVSGAMLANPAGQPEDVLLAAGVVVVTGPVTSLGYAQVVVTGQFVAPEASREVLEPRIEVQGQSAWYRSDNPRVIFEDTSIGPDFFRLLDNPVSLIVLSDLCIAPGVTETMLQEKVTDIVLLGDITAPAALVPVLQVLAAEAHGAIQASDGSGS